MVVKAVSAGYDAGNFAHISINNESVTINQNENGNFKGLHIVLLNGKTGKMETIECFDTSDKKMECEELDAFIESEIPNGFIVIAACKDDCVSGLS